VTRNKIAFVLFGLLFATAAFSAPHLEGLAVSDSKDGDSMESFPPTTPKIFGHAGLVDVPSGAKIVVSWIAVDTKGVAPANYKIDSAEFTAGMIDNTATFDLSKPNNSWPVGKYRVEVTIDGKPAGSQKFEIQAAE
jgi:hypothetical protein